MCVLVDPVVNSTVGGAFLFIASLVLLLNSFECFTCSSVIFFSLFRSSMFLTLGGFSYVSCSCECHVGTLRSLLRSMFSVFIGYCFLISFSFAMFSFFALFLLFDLDIFARNCCSALSPLSSMRSRNSPYFEDTTYYCAP